MSDNMDDQLARARRLLDKADTRQAAGDNTQPSNGWGSEALEKAKKFCAPAFNYAALAYRKSEPLVHVAIWPVVNIAWPVTRMAAQGWWRFFTWSAYPTNKKTGEKEFSWVGAVQAPLFTAAAIVAAPYAARFAYDCSMSLTERTQYVYIHGSETVEEGEVYSIRTSPEIPMTDEDSLYLHVKTDYYPGYWIINPEDFAAIPQETGWGKIKYTGWRNKILGFFPEVKDIEFMPLDSLPADHAAKSTDYERHRARWWWEGEEELDAKGYPVIEEEAAPPPAPAIPAPQLPAPSV